MIRRFRTTITQYVKHAVVTLASKCSVNVHRQQRRQSRSQQDTAAARARRISHNYIKGKHSGAVSARTRHARSRTGRSTCELLSEPDTRSQFLAFVVAGAMGCTPPRRVEHRPSAASAHANKRTGASQRNSHCFYEFLILLNDRAVTGETADCHE